MKKGRATRRTTTLGQFSSYDEDGEGRTLAGYDGPSRPATLEEFWAEHARHGVVYRRDSEGSEVALVECELCYGASLYLDLFSVILGQGLFFEICEEG